MPLEPINQDTWLLYTDDSSAQKKAGGGIYLKPINQDTWLLYTDGSSA